MFDNSALSYNLDTALDLASRITWVIFIAYAIIFFVWNVFKYGPKLAIIREFSYRVLGPLLLAIGINLFSLAVVFIQPTMVGVVISVLSPGGMRPKPVTAGFHLITPLLEQVKTYPIYWQTYTMSGNLTEGQKLGEDSIRARTNDGQEVFLDCSIIFKVNANQAVMVHIDWQDRYIEDMVRPMVRGFVRTEVSQFTVDEVNSSDRKDLETTLNRLLLAEFADKGIILDRFLLRDITFSPEYVSAVENKQVALQGQKQKEYEAEQIRRLARGRADAVEIEAKAQAIALKLIAEALKTNPDLLTYQYIDRISPNIRVMLLPNNNPLILPLPSLDETIPLTSTLAPTQTTTAPSLVNP